MTGKQGGVGKSKNLLSKEKYLMTLSFSNTRKNLSKDYSVSLSIKHARRAFFRLIVGLMGRVAGSIHDIKPAKEMSVAPPCPDAKSD
jgi:hypothetical protein